MDRLARNLDDLRRLVQLLTKRGMRIEFVKESLRFTDEESAFFGNGLYRSIEHNEVLNISKDNFRLRKPIDRRIYEIARKHCGDKIECKVSLDVLHKKTVATLVLKEFSWRITTFSKADALPDYQVSYDKESDLVIFNNRDPDYYHKVYVKRI